jgi:hypothetical protein
VFVVEGSAAGRRLRVLRAPMSSVCGAGLVPQTVSNAGAHLMGATTYAVMAGHWPGAFGPFAKR